MCSVADHEYPHACSRQGSWSRANVENEVELRCQKLPERTLANGFHRNCSLEHQVVATPFKLAKMSSVTWQLIATRRLHRHENHDTSRPLCLEHEESIQHVGRQHDCKTVTSHYNALDTILTILHQQCSDMQLDVGQDIVELSCVECCVKLVEFAHTSACVGVPCICSSDEHDSFSGVFHGLSAGTCAGDGSLRPVEMQHYTSLRKFFVLGALVPAVLLATWWVRLPSMTGGVGNPTTVVK